MTKDVTYASKSAALGLGAYLILGSCSPQEQPTTPEAISQKSLEQRVHVPSKSSDDFNAHEKMLSTAPSWVKEELKRARKDGFEIPLDLILSESEWERFRVSCVNNIKDIDDTRTKYNEIGKELNREALRKKEYVKIFERDYVPSKESHPDRLVYKNSRFDPDRGLIVYHLVTLILDDFPELDKARDDLVVAMKLREMDIERFVKEGTKK